MSIYKKSIFLSFLFVIVVVLCWQNKRICSAEDYKDVGEANDIGVYSHLSDGYSHVGVKVNENDITKYYALDTWKRNADDWSYVGSNNNGNKGKIDNDRFNSNLVWFFDGNDYRFMMVSSNAQSNNMKLTDYSVVLRCYRWGELISSGYELYNTTFPTPLGDLSYVKAANSLSSYSPYGMSYVYDLYSPVEIKQDGVLSVNVGEGMLQKAGKAYKTDKGYYLETLPSTVYTKTGYDIQFLGWYSEPVGGEKYEEKDIIPEGTTLYAHWEKKPKEYRVTCIDIATDTGKVLGQNSWMQGYETEVTLDIAGSDIQPDAYYKDYMISDFTSAKVAMDNTTVYRYFRKAEYTIVFNGNGATAGDMMNINGCKYNETITLTQNCFQKENKITLHSNTDDTGDKTSEIYVSQKFLGWSLQPNGAVRYSDEALYNSIAEFNQEVTLYAVWGNEKTEIPYTPKRLGYQFIGWSLDPEAKNGSTQHTIESDMDLYAIWEPDIVKYQIEYYKEDLEGNYERTASYQMNGYTNSEAKIDTGAEIYKGFSLDKEASTLCGSIRADGSLILSAFFRRNTYSLSYHYNGGEADGNSIEEVIITAKYGTKVEVTTQKAVRTGYVFKGWSQSPDGEHTIYQPGEKITIQNHDAILYAVWQPLRYNIYFEANCDNSKYAGKVEVIKADFSKEIILPDCGYKRAGYEFISWNTKADGDGLSYSKNDSFKRDYSESAGDVTFYAQWKPIEFTITYNKNETPQMKSQILGMVPNTNYCFEKDSYASEILFQALGYDLVSWNTKPDGSGISCKPGENIKGKLSSKTETTLYAIWREKSHIGFLVELYEASENMDDAEVSMENTSLIDSIVLYGKEGEQTGNIIKEKYNEKLAGEDIKYFYSGYEVLNENEFKKTIQIDSSTILKLMVTKRKRCNYSFNIYTDEKICQVASGSALYSEKVTLPDEIEGISVAQYTDNIHSYSPNAELIINHNYKLFLQHSVKLYGASDEFQDLTEYVIHGAKMKLPIITKKGHDFLGWYNKDNIFIGKNGELSDSIMQNQVYYARWSKPLTYNINYDIDDINIRILENQITSYQYGTKVILPTVNQLWIADEYRFVGWYDAEDSNRRIITELSKEDYGNKTIKALLIRKITQELEDNKQNNETTSKINSSTERIHLDNTTVIKTGGVDNNCYIGKKFWYRKIKYQIISNSSKKATVKVIGIKSTIKKVVIPQNVLYNRKVCKVVKIGKKAFYKKSNIVSVIIPNTVTKIESYAFAKMKYLRKVTIGNKVNTISKKAFYKDKKLKKVVVKGDKLKKIAKSAFLKTNKTLKLCGKNRIVEKIKDKCEIV